MRKDYENEDVWAEKRDDPAPHEHAPHEHAPHSVHEEKGEAHHQAASTKAHTPLHHKEEKIFTVPVMALLGAAVILMLFNQYQLMGVSAMVDGFSSGSSATILGGKDLSKLDVNSLKSTAHTIAAVFPVEDFKSSEDAMAAMFPTGTSEYAEELGVSFDDPIASLDKLSKMYPSLKAEVQKSNPEAWKKFMALASKPVGMSCEYCCGIGVIGIDKNGNSACGCQHNPAILAVSLYLTAYTDYSEGEILREAMRWKTLFFPKNMIELGTSLAGGDSSKLENLPGMVGGC